MSSDHRGPVVLPFRTHGAVHIGMFCIFGAPLELVECSCNERTPAGGRLGTGGLLALTGGGEAVPVWRLGGVAVMPM